jgi:hypothetical protein
MVVNLALFILQHRRMYEVKIVVAGLCLSTLTLRNICLINSVKLKEVRIFSSYIID